MATIDHQSGPAAAGHSANAIDRSPSRTRTGGEIRFSAAIASLITGIALTTLGFAVAGPWSGGSTTSPWPWVALGFGLLVTGAAAGALVIKAAAGRRQPLVPPPISRLRSPTEHAASSPTRFVGDEIVQDGELTRELLGTNSALSLLVFESMDEGVVVTDVSGRVLVLNPTAKRVFGAQAVQLPTNEWPDRLGILLHDEKTRCSEQDFPIVRAMRGESVREIELLIRHTDAGDGVWINGGARPLEDEQGRIRGALMVFREVTIRKRVEAALRHERALVLRQQQRQAAMAEIDLSIVEVRELRRLFDRLGDIVQELLPADAACVVVSDDEIETLMREETPLTDHEFAGDARLMGRHEGAVRWILENKKTLTVGDVADDPFGPPPLPAEFGLEAYVGVPLLDEGEPTGVLFALERKPTTYDQDDLDFLATLATRAAEAITKVRLYERLRSVNESLRRRSAELQENEQRFRMLADTAPVLIWMSGTDKRCTYFNKPRLEFSGRTLEDESGNGWMDIIHPEDFESCFRIYDGSFDRREPFRMEYRLRRADGRFRWMLDIGTPRFAPTGEFLGYIGSCIDITDRREAEAELARHRLDLEDLVRERTKEVEESHRQLQVADRLAAIGTLTAGLGHDMDNVLFPVRCRLEALEWKDIPDDLRDTFHAVSHAVEYLQQLTDGLRLFALDPEDAEASSVLTNLADWWPRVSSLLEKAQSSHVTLECDLHEGLPAVLVAPHRLTQAVLNLVVNAAEAMPDGGRIRVWADAIDEGRTVRIGVTDEGQGMTAEVRKQAFDPFFTTKSRGISTGLGLSLVHSVVKASRGTIDVDSAPGEGTTITLTFPAAERDAAPRVEIPTGAAAATAAVTIDDARVAAWTAGLLRNAGFDVVQATPNDDDELRVWVTTSTRKNLENARTFLESRSDRRVMVFGPAGPEWLALGATVVEEQHDLDTLQIAIRDLAASRQGVEA